MMNMRRAHLAWLAPIAAALVMTPTGGAARARNHALVLYAANGGDGFNNEAKALAAALHRRGYTTQLADTYAGLHPFRDIKAYLAGETAGVPSAQNLSKPDALQRGDRFVLAIQCHGGLNPGVYLNATDTVDPDGLIVPARARNGQQLGDHNACSLTSTNIADLATFAKDHGVEMIVIDSSCSGGATTFMLEPMGVCAISTAAPGSPSVTGDPPFSQYFGKPFVRTFADLAVAGGMTIFAQFPERHQQSGFYSTSAAHAVDALSMRSALFAYEQSLGGWNLFTTDVYPYVFQAAATAAVRGRLGMRDPERPGNPSFDQLMKMSESFARSLDDELKTIAPKWRQEDADPPARKVALFTRYREQEFVTSPLEFSSGAGPHGPLIARDQANHVPLLQPQQIPPTIPLAHRQVLHLIQIIQNNHRVLAENLTALEALVRARRAGSPSRPSPEAEPHLAAILRAEQGNQSVVVLLSKLLGILEDVEARGDGSPCDVPIS